MNTDDLSKRIKSGEKWTIDYAEPEPPDDVIVSTREWLGLAILLALACGICFLAGVQFGKWVMA